MRKRSWRRKLAYATAVTLVPLTIAVGGLLAADVYVHRRVQNLGGVNIWGYRGPAVGRKQPNQVRAVVLGGSTAFGYGVAYNEAIPFYLEQLLNARAPAGTPYRVINLGAPSQGAYGFRFDLEDYAYLGYDIAILYEGYNDLGMRDVPTSVPQRAGPNYSLWRRQSPLFRMAGYFPILPVVLREKAMSLMAGGDLDAAYRGRVVFKPGLATRATAATLQSAASIAERLGFQFGKFSGDPGRITAETPLVDVENWRHYTSSVLNAVAFARQRGVKVLVVTQPYATDTHVRQQHALSQALAAQYGSDHGVRYVNLGLTVDLRDPAMAYDGVHLVASGNERIARNLVDAVLSVSAR